MTTFVEDNRHFYITPDGRTAASLKEVRQLMKVSGRKVSYLVKAGIVNKVIIHQNVNNDEQEEKSKE